MHIHAQYLHVYVQYLHVHLQCPHVHYLQVTLYLADASLCDEELHISRGQQGDVTERNRWGLMYRVPVPEVSGGDSVLGIQRHVHRLIVVSVSLALVVAPLHHLHKTKLEDTARYATSSSCGGPWPSTKAFYWHFVRSK